VTPGFDHAKTAYPLTDLHAEVTCDKCHANEALKLRRDAAGRTIPRYKPLPHNECSSCHTDPHLGRLGPKCTDCHTTKGFKVMDRRTFDHDRTRYPLQGRHVSVACTKCHDFNTPQGKKPAFGSCTACHSDAHGGTATLAGKPADCSACHDVNGFNSSTFTVAQHRQARYPLQGKHEAVPCASCHRKDPAAPVAQVGTSKVILRPVYGRCVDCHADDHGGQLVNRADHGECAACHTTAGWKPSTFDIEAHGRLRLTLTGKHAAIACAACHSAQRAGLPPIAKGVSLGKAAVLLRPAESTCGDCHLDPHEGRFAPQGERAKPDGCVACHDTKAFRPSTVTVEAHHGYSFDLAGAHRAVPCAACHPDMKNRASARSSLVGSGVKFGSLRLASGTNCTTCHQSPHGEQFAARKDGGRCESCHDLDGFAPATRFDHNRDAAFSLKGAHQGVPCAKCHTTTTGANGQTLVLYRPVSSKCESCHGNLRGK
jgi:hypothetical protein